LMSAFLGKKRERNKAGRGWGIQKKVPMERPLSAEPTNGAVERYSKRICWDGETQARRREMSARTTRGSLKV